MTPNPKSIEEPDSWDVYSPQTENCKSTNGLTFFQFQYSDTLSNIPGVGKLTIENWEFHHFFYDFTSLIGLANGYGHVVIKGSTFTKFSNCGSIIRDEREFPDINYMSPGVNTNSEGPYRSSMVLSKVLQTKWYTVPSSPCLSSEWASIKIEDCSFSDFNYLKSNVKEIPNVLPTSKMKKQGIIVNLSNYYGTVSLKGNNFNQLRFKFENCEIRNAGMTSTSNIYEVNPQFTSVYQGKTLVSA